MNSRIRGVAMSFCASLALGLVSSSAIAGPKFDLDRIEPVPADQQIPIQDFFRPRLLSEPKLNLTGTHVAAIITASEDRHQLLVYDLKTQKIETFCPGGDADIYQVDWLDARRLVFHISARKIWGLALFAADVGKIDEPYLLLQYLGSYLVSVPIKNRLRPLVWNQVERIKVGVNRINTDIKTGQFVNLLTANGRITPTMEKDNDDHVVETYPVPEHGIVYSYLADKEGELAFAFTGDEKGDLMMHRLVDGKWVRCPVDLEAVDVIGCGDEPGQIVVRGPRQEGKPRALQFMDAATGRLGDVLMQDKGYDFHGWLYRDPINHNIIGVMGERAAPFTTWFNDEYRNLQKVLNGFFPNTMVRIIGSNEAQNFFLVASFSDRQPPIYSWVDLEKKTAGLLKKSAPWIDPQRMQPVNMIKFKTRDGRQLDAYLTMPKGARKMTPPPLVVLCHGGPWSRDSWGFDSEAQFLVSRGYAVLQPNFRGSTGCNWMFPLEDEWDFRKMYDDVIDATKTMIASGLIDSERIGIMGASFGGYLAIAGVVNEPTLFRCAVTNAGVFDWEDDLKDQKFYKYSGTSFGRYLRKLGDPKKQPEKFDAISPGRHVDKIRVPVFVAGGKEDYTVDIKQSKDLVSALRKYNVPYESMLVSGEGHGMARFEHRVEFYTRIEAFLEKYLKPAKPAAGSTSGTN